MRIVSGIQPTGKLHIGNYLGAIKYWVKLQKENECIFIIADLHSLTIPYNPNTLKKRVLDTAVSHLAAGINPQKSVLFVQSEIGEHTELAWLLSTVCPVGKLKRMTQYKKKAKQFKKNINAGLLNYPVLQAADILLYEADIVPVGKDQKQHLELTRDIAKKFNRRFGKTFKIPKIQVPKTEAKIMSLKNPKDKMSKSVPQGCLFLSDPPSKIREKIGGAVTDSGTTIKYSSRKPGISNLLTIYSSFSQKSISESEKEFQGKSYQEFKESLAQQLTRSLKPFREKRKKLLKREVYLEKVLEDGAQKAQTLATSTLRKVKQKMGLK